MPKGRSDEVVKNSIRHELQQAVTIQAAQGYGQALRKSIACALLTVLLSLLSGVSATNTSAQAVYGSIGGTVVDSSGGMVADAKVTITDSGRNIVYSTTTNSSGAFMQSHLIIGTYKVQVEAAGFKTAVQEKVEVAVDTVQTLDITMQPGDIKQTVTVTGETPLLKTERTDVATTLSDRQVTELPSFGRNFSELLLYTPGAVQFNWNDTSTENPQGGIAVNVNGQEFVGVGAFLDGTDNRDMMYGNMIIVPDLDAVVQAKITSANYDAEFGQVSAAVVTTSTKSGTNEFHGGVSWYRRTDATYARDPFAQAPDPTTHIANIPTTHWNQVVGTIGGPIKKNKAFFFVDYQGTRAKDGGSAQARVPTQAERNGDFSAWLAQGVVIYNPYNALGQIVDPTLRTPYVNNQVPVTTVAQNLLKNVPLPNLTTTKLDDPNYAGGFSDTYNADLLTARGDYFYSDHLRFFDRYTYTQFFKSAPGLFGPIGGGPQLNPVGYTGTGDTRPQSNSFGFDYTMKPTLVTDFRFGYYRQRIFVNPLALGSFASDAGAPGLNIPGDPTTNSMPHFSIQGRDGSFDFGNGLYNNCNCPLIEIMQQFQFVNNWTWTKGNHTFKFGPDIRRLQNLRVPSDQHRSGEIAFTPEFTQGPTGGGLGIASFMLGEVSSFQRYVSNSLDAGERQWRSFFYGEDTWKATPKLTVNYGLRWEIYNPQTVTGKDKGGWLDIHTGEMLVAGENGVPLSGPVKNSFKNLAPRLGIAYQVNSKTVVRMGYGRSFDVGMFGSIFGHSVTQNLPVLGTQSLQPSNNWDHVFNLAEGPQPLDPSTVLDATPLGPTGNHLYPNGIRAYVYPDRMRLPTVDAWNATIQRQITNTFSLEAAYVGNKGTHIFVGEGPNIDINIPTVTGFCQDPSQPGCLSTDQRRPFFNEFGWNVPLPCFCNLGNNKYNALQTKAEKRFSHGLSVLGHYTFSHSKNNDGPYFLWDHNLFYGRPDWQRNHTIVAATLYELPFGRGKQFLHDVSKPVDYLIGGWQLSNATTWMSGQGFNVSYANCGADNDVGVCLPDLVGSTTPSHRSQNQWYTPASTILATNGQVSGPWGRPQAGTFGDVGRNHLVGPRWFDSDLSVFKTFPIREQIHAQFRAEIYNVFNHANLGNPAGCVDCGNGGEITNLAPNATMRRMQFALRVEF
jgi:outer membrane receptor protein involved in Fe transport